MGRFYEHVRLLIVLECTRERVRIKSEPQRPGEFIADVVTCSTVNYVRRSRLFQK